MGRAVLIDPVYDPDKIGLVYMPPAAQDIAPCNGYVVAVGHELADEIKVGDRVLVSRLEWNKTKGWYDEADYEYLFYRSHEVIAFVDNNAGVTARRSSVIVRPLWKQSGPVQHGNLFTIDRVFEAPKPPQVGVVTSTGEGVTTVKVNDVVAIPETGGHELGVKDTVYYSFWESDILGILHAVKNDKYGTDRRRRKASSGPR